VTSAKNGPEAGCVVWDPSWPALGLGGSHDDVNGDMLALSASTEQLIAGGWFTQASADRNGGNRNR